MRRGRLVWRVIAPFLLLLLAGLSVLTWLTDHRVQQGLVTTRGSSLRSALSLAAPRLSLPLADYRSAATTEERDRCHDVIRTTCRDINQTVDAAIHIVTPGGEIFGEVRAANRGGGDLPVSIETPEVHDVLAGNGASVHVYQSQYAGAVIGVAVPVTSDSDEVIGVLHATIDADPTGSLRVLTPEAIGWILIIAFVAFAVSWWRIGNLLQPMKDVRDGVERIAGGDLTTRLPSPDIEELQGLVDAINHMAAQLDERLQALAQQYNQTQAMFASMVEGVIAVDNQERVIAINAAGAALSDMTPQVAEGRSFYEVLRHAALQRFVARTLVSTEPIEEDITLITTPERVLKCHGTVLRDTDGHNLGAVIVLHDVTRLHHLEDMRRDFVANVSHELRTPVTSIKGFGETLLDGALHSRDNAERFVRIIIRHADRLHAIIEDLLSLSRLEQAGDQGLQRQKVRLRELLQTVADLAGSRLRGHSIEIGCDPDLEVRVAGPLLEQAVLNLVDNAIKYSPPGTPINVDVECGNDHVDIHVRDQGPGIKPEHLERLFERFYRVDKGRSRLVGGTGLGLSIVKHIVQAHGGRVQATSAPGEGSTFSIRLPWSHRHASITVDS